MSVFTTVTPEQLSAWLKRFALGDLVQLQGIATGIENTNYFVTTTHGRYVLTLFEKLTAAELPFYLNLMAHLARHGIPCPLPIAHLDNHYLGELNDKPAAIFTCVPGVDLKQVTVAQCATLGQLLAEMHIASAGYTATMENPRGHRWWEAALPKVLPHLSPEAAVLLKGEVHFQATRLHPDLPRGVIHADLFRDNVLWNGERIGGIIDFYFACTGALAYDVAITVNDWCIADDNASSGALDDARCTALLNAYHKVRPFTDAECAAWPTLLRAAALRFWVSRLYDMYLPRAGALTHAKDPGHFERILRHHIRHVLRIDS
jgi:homoserine kinase type II